MTYLPQFFEGPVEISNITLADNTITGDGPAPIHCGPLCEMPGCQVRRTGNTKDIGAGNPHGIFFNHFLPGQLTVFHDILTHGAAAGLGHFHGDRSYATIFEPAGQ